MLAQVLAKHPRMQELNVARNALGAGGLQALLGGPRVGLTVLDLSQCELAGEALQPLGALLAGAECALAHLRLSDNRLPQGMPHLAAALGSNTSLQRLVLDACELGDDDVCALAAALAPNRTLQQLSLRSNPGLGDAAAAALAGWLRGPHAACTSLDLGQCSLGGRALLAFADAARLEHLGLFGNGLGERGLLDTLLPNLQALRSLAALRELDLGGNGLDDQLASQKNIYKKKEKKRKNEK